MKYLYINGDSFCGDKIKEGRTFGDLLGQKYNLEVKHEWRSGSSNHRIYRTTIDFIMNNKSKLHDYLFLIGWTKPTRFELYDTIHQRYIAMGHTNFYRMMRGEDTQFLPEINRPSWEKDLKLSDEFKKEYITKFVDFDNMLDEHMRRVYSLECILKANNCKYLFYNIFNDTYRRGVIRKVVMGIKSLRDRDTLLVKKVHRYGEREKEEKGKGEEVSGNYLWNNANELFDWENWILPDSSFDEYLMEYSQRSVRRSSKDDHPNELGHRIWYQVVRKKINSMNIL
jgi:hypothetical protein